LLNKDTFKKKGAVSQNFTNSSPDRTAEYLLLAKYQLHHLRILSHKKIMWQMEEKGNEFRIVPLCPWPIVMFILA